MDDVFNFKNLAYNFQNAESLNRSNVSCVKYGTETITSSGAKILNQRLNPKLKIGKQINALADYAKPISSELALFDWPLLRQINVC